MRRPISYFLLAGLLLGACVNARAIAVEDLPKSEAPPTDEGYSFNWDYIYKYKNSSSVAVDHYWIITAGHVADDGPSGNLNIGGETYIQQEVVFHPVADLALARYDKPLPGYYPLSDSVPLDDEVLFCGFGFSGTVVSSSFSAYFTDNLTGNGIKRWGSNRIDNDIPYSYEAPSPLGWTTNQGFEVTISTTKPNAGKTLYEAGGNVYDSGAGLFHNDEGIWELVGTMTTRTNNGFNYTGNFAVATKYYVSWIKSVIVDYDTDMDGLPDWWESDYGGDPTSMDAAADLDGDNFSNYTEWISDTDPTNAASLFQIIEWLAPTNVTFSSSADRAYQIETRADLVDTNEAWQTELDWFAGLAGQTETNVTGATSSRFYRIRAKLNY